MSDSSLYHPFLIGEKCYLRGLEETDLNETYLNWLNDEDVTRYLETGRYPASIEGLRAYFEGGRNDPSTVRFAICDKASNAHIGNITLRQIHPTHRRADLGMMIGDKRFWGKGYATEATFLLIDYGFRRLNLHSIWLGVLTENVAAVRAYEKVGFKIDGTNREAWWANGKYHDVHIMSVLAQEHFARYPTQ